MRYLLSPATLTVGRNLVSSPEVEGDRKVFQGSGRGEGSTRVVGSWVSSKHEDRTIFPHSLDGECFVLKNAFEDTP